MSDSNNSLQKLVIRSFNDRNFSDEKKDRLFSTPINPETFSQSFKVSADDKGGHGNQGNEVKYKSSPPEELKLDFILDGTKVMEGYGSTNKELFSKPVHDQLEALKKCVYYVIPETHRPPFLTVFWGTEINFRCVLVSLDVNFTLFEPDGSPLRAKVSASFKAHKTREEIQAENKLSSPDLTHYRKITEGNRLDLMTFSIYNDSKYFLQVAKSNDLTNLRKLKTGNELYFPPFDKNEI